MTKQFFYNTKDEIKLDKVIQLQYFELKNKLSYLTKKELKVIDQAFSLAKSAHENQVRSSFSPYITHPIEVSMLLAELKLDANAIATGLLHDTVEDTGLSYKAIKKKLNEDIANLVLSLTKIDELTKQTNTEFMNQAGLQNKNLQQDAKVLNAINFRKIILSMGDDIRVILIKLADRLHNVKTLEYLRLDKQKRIAKETIEIYDPIAKKLGLNAWSNEFQRYCFNILQPIRAKTIEHHLQQVKGDNTKIINKITRLIYLHLKEKKITGKVFGREKSPFSVYQKMLKQKLKFSEILDLFAFRIIVENIDQCYIVLGLIHSIFKPVEATFDDYIAIPKQNGYQSLHTTVIGVNNLNFEFQIRTNSMDDFAETGIASHADYKNKSLKHYDLNLNKFNWIKDLIDLNKDINTNHLDFLENVKTNLNSEVIHVFTPKADIVSLPNGATVLDFAYALHSKIGLSAKSARIDKVISSLRTKLKSGQIVEIIRGKIAPTPTSLNFVATSKARLEIRHALKEFQEKNSSVLGEQILSNELALLKFNLDKLTKSQKQSIVDELGLKTWKDLLVDIAIGERLSGVVALQIFKFLNKDGSKLSDGSKKDILISGTKGLHISFANCCQPIHGDKILATISKYHGMVIHRVECVNLKNNNNYSKSLIGVKWNPKNDNYLIASLQIKTSSRMQHFAEITQAIEKQKIELVSLEYKEKTVSSSIIFVKIKVQNLDVMNKLIQTLHAVDSVRSVIRD